MVSASGRPAISRYMSRKLLAVDRRFISLHSSRYWGKNVAIFPLCIAKIVVETESLHFVTVYLAVLYTALIWESCSSVHGLVLGYRLPHIK